MIFSILPASLYFLINSLKLSSFTTFSKYSGFAPAAIKAAIIEPADASG